MWIWVLSSSDGGDPTAIIARARSEGVRTLIIKSGDGSSMWPQFNAQSVAWFHAAGLRVCAWQYVYGNYPDTEAAVGAAAVAAGADCLVVDAESEYEGRYVQAQTYLRDLRAAVGESYPLALAGLPYIDYHPAFPYSVFLGPHGAQVDAPQMYWKDIGVSVDEVYAHTFAFNRIYGRPIRPLGQLYSDPAPTDVERFRLLSLAYGANGLSWWDWQETSTRGWQAIQRPISLAPLPVVDPSPATLSSGAHGDLVVWAEEHLRSAGFPVDIDGVYGSSLAGVVATFQMAHGLPEDGVLGPLTWQALLRYPAEPVTWVQEGSQLTASAASGLRVPVPAWAGERHERDELHGRSGRGRPALS